MEKSFEEMHRESQDQDVLYIVDISLLEGTQLGAAGMVLAWRARSNGKFPVAGEEITAFGKLFHVVGTFGNKVFVKSRLDGIQVKIGQQA
jgi:hypothetical protein